jgi:guanylate kinase
MSNEKREKLILLGHSGSGKDFLRRSLVKLGLRYSPKFTTRPKRKLEEEGIDYNFITIKDFENLKSDGQVKVFQEFLISGEIWTYGISKNNWEQNQLFIMTRHELEQVDLEERKNCFVVFLNIDVETRKKRLLKRNDQNDSIDRRIKADEEDFKDFRDYDLSITDPEFESEWIYDIMN